MFGMKLYEHPKVRIINPDFPDEPQPRRHLLVSLICDMRGQENLYLTYIDKAESGETTLDLYNNLVNVELHSDGRVVVEDLWGDDTTPDRTELTLTEARQLILDWLDAKAKWIVEHGPPNDGTATDSR